MIRQTPQTRAGKFWPREVLAPKVFDAVSDPPASARCNRSRRVYIRNCRASPSGIPARAGTQQFQRMGTKRFVARAAIGAPWALPPHGKEATREWTWNLCRPSDSIWVVRPTPPPRSARRALPPSRIPGFHCHQPATAGRLSRHRQPDRRVRRVEDCGGTRLSA